MIIDEFTKQQIKTHLRDYLDEIARKGNNGLYFDPTDPSDKVASLSLFENGTQFKNFGNGGEHKGDIFTLYAEINNLDIKNDFMKIAEELAQKFSIDLKYSTEKNSTEIKKQIETPQKDFTEYYNSLQSAAENKEASEYLKSRCIADDLIKKYNILFDDYKKQIVIPVSNYYYKGRNIDPEKIEKYGKHYNPSKAITDIWNKENLKDSDINTCIYITESITDCLAIESINPSIKTIALNSTAYKEKLYSAIKDLSFKGYFVLCLDSDDSGIKASAELKSHLEAIGIYAYLYNKDSEAYSGQKDFNEFLINNSKDFLQQKLEQMDTEAKEDHKRFILKDFTPTSEYLEEFEKEIQHTNIYKPQTTNIKLFDYALYGGFFAKQIITLIADTSIGKTAFALQLADNIAQNRPVLYFSLEMSQSEMIARSISRIIGENQGNPFEDTDLTFSQIELLQGKQFETSKGCEIYETARQQYIDKVKDNLYIYECLEDNENDIKSIENKIIKFIAKTNSKPQVFIDYLQFVGTDDKQSTDKQQIDKIVRTLKNIARKQEINIFVISSTARQNYNQEKTLNSGKGSGDIEFTSDIVLALNLEKVEDTKTDTKGNLTKESKREIKKAYSNYTRNIKLSILKNRNGKRDIDIKGIEYTPKINYFDFSTAELSR